MESIELPTQADGLRITNMIDWKPQPSVVPDVELLADIRRRRARQSEHSRKRQAFITGMPINRTDANELAAKRRYIEEWHGRIADNG